MLALRGLALAGLLSFSLAGPVSFKHGRLHKRLSTEPLTEQALEISVGGSSAPTGTVEELQPTTLPPTCITPPDMGNFTHYNSTLTNCTLANSTISNVTTTSYSRSFSLSTAAPTAFAGGTVNDTNTSLSLYPTPTSVIVDATSTLTSPTPTTTTTTTSSNTSFLRGVNIGNWLVLEKWMDSTNIFSGAFESAIDQYTFDEVTGAASALQQHWDTWFTESDMAYLASTGINAVRIPIGYWAYNNTGSPYISGADAYLEKAISWATTYNIKVWIDCHGSPGSQNGFDNSGHAGSVDWQSPSNLALSISVLTTMATKYGTANYSDVVDGLELTNEPISWGANDFSTTQQFARDAYTAVKSAAANPNFDVIMHDAFMTASENWLSLPSELGTTISRAFGIDTHLYQVFDASYASLDGPGHIAAACAWSQNLSLANAVLPIYAGEWAAAMNICIDPSTNTTTAGTSCSMAGCQCTTSTAIDAWSPGLKEIVGKFVEAQLDVFEQNASGYFLWAYKGPGGWGFENLVEAGVMPSPVTSRRYAPQCSNGSYAS